jgi:hypothetical protein
MLPATKSSRLQSFGEKAEDLLRCIWCAISVKLKPVPAGLRSPSCSSVAQKGALVISLPWAGRLDLREIRVALW